MYRTPRERVWEGVPPPTVEVFFGNLGTKYRGGIRHISVFRHFFIFCFQRGGGGGKFTKMFQKGGTGRVCPPPPLDPPLLIKPILSDDYDVYELMKY